MMGNKDRTLVVYTNDKVCIYNEVWATEGPGRAPVGEEGLPLKFAVRIMLCE